LDLIKTHAACPDRDFVRSVSPEVLRCGPRTTSEHNVHDLSAIEEELSSESLTGADRRRVTPRTVSNHEKTPEAVHGSPVGQEVGKTSSPTFSDNLLPPGVPGD
jgi:hypothetical protein